MQTQDMHKNYKFYKNQAICGAQHFAHLSIPVWLKILSNAVPLMTWLLVQWKFFWSTQLILARYSVLTTLLNQNLGRNWTQFVQLTLYSKCHSLYILCIPISTNSGRHLHSATQGDLLVPWTTINQEVLQLTTYRHRPFYIAHPLHSEQFHSELRTMSCTFTIVSAVRIAS